MIKKKANGGAHAGGAGDRREKESRDQESKKAPVKKNRDSRAASAAAKKEAAAAEKRAAAAEKQAAREAKTAAKAAKPKKNFKKLKITLIVIALILALLAAGATVGGYFVTKSETNLPKVYVDGIDVGGLTKAETEARLDEHQWDENVSYALRVKLPAGVSFKLDVCKAGAMFTKDAAVRAAYRYGHSANWFDNLFRYAMNLVMPVDVSETYMRLDEEYIRGCAEKGIEKFQKKTADTGYVVDEKNEMLRIVKGAGQMEIDLDKLCRQISQALLDDQRLLEYVQIDNSLSMPDFEAIHQELGKEPADAYFEEGSFEIVPEVVGCSFDVEQAKSLWQTAQPGETVLIPLEISYPEKTAESLKSLLFRDKLGSQMTYYTWSSDNRINNIKLAVASLDGLILMPGDVFSYNEALGQRTEAAGYLPAGAYNDGQVVQELGGGICQVSSTLYCAAMLSQLETVERTSHYFKVNYLDWGLDATVSWGGPDYRFRNNREYPIKLVAWCNDEDESVTIEVWGTDVDGSYVELRHSMGCIYDDEYTNVIIGYGVSLTRTVYDKDGNYLYKVTEPYGIYNLHEEDIKWPEPEPDPAPIEPDYGGEPDAGGGDPAVIVPEE